MTRAPRDAVLPVKSVPEAVLRVAAPVEARLSGLLDAEIGRWSSVDRDLAAPLGSLRGSVLSGGKRLRPSFCYWSFVGAGGDAGDPAVIDAGSALEMLHCAALLHDDVIDGSETRHGAPTVHVEHAGLHRGRGWSGSSERFGAGVAVLAGDLALVYGDRLMRGATPEALAVYDEMRLEVNVGQYLDVVGAADRSRLHDPSGPERAMRICRYKTAKYTVERPLHLGAALAAPSRFPEMAGALSAFALPLGEAFQLRDDLLGVYGDPGRTGKPVGDDLREGKPTMLAALTASRASGAGSALFDQHFGSKDLDADGVAALLQLIDSTGAREEVERMIDLLAGEASEALEGLPLSGEALAALRDIAEFCTGRDR